MARSDHPLFLPGITEISKSKIKKIKIKRSAPPCPPGGGSGPIWNAHNKVPQWSIWPSLIKFDWRTWALGGWTTHTHTHAHAHAHTHTHTHTQTRRCGRDQCSVQCIQYFNVVIIISHFQCFISMITFEKQYHKPAGDDGPILPPFISPPESRKFQNLKLKKKLK